MPRQVDVVAILDAANQPVLTGAQFLRATVFDAARLMEHPLENGSLTADHIVFEPVEIDLPMMLTGDAAKQIHIQLRKLYLTATKLIVQTRVDTYAFMILTEIPHDETAEAADAITVNVRLREAVFVDAAYGGPSGLAPAKVKSKPQASTVKKGAQQTTTAPPATKQKGSLLYQFSGLGKGG